jgi:hypothetical protein
MSKKIKKLKISACKSGFRCWQPNEIEEQSLTIKNNGQIWWSTTRTLTMEEAVNGFPNDKVRTTEYKNIGKEKATKILDQAEKFFKDKINTEFKTFICDGSPDTVFIAYENDEVLFGLLNDFTYQSDEMEAFYDYLSKELLIENLFFFNN